MRVHVNADCHSCVGRSGTMKLLQYIHGEIVSLWLGLYISVTRNTRLLDPLLPGAGVTIGDEADKCES